METVSGSIAGEAGEGEWKRTDLEGEAATETTTLVSTRRKTITRYAHECHNPSNNSEHALRSDPVDDPEDASDEGNLEDQRQDETCGAKCQRRGSDQSIKQYH